MWRNTLLLAALLPALPACETEDACDGIDNDGDGYYDEDHERDEVIRPFYVDADGDGFGDVDFVVTPPIWACAAPEEMVDNNLDCDDTDGDIHPDAAEACNGIDDDCDLLVDEGVGDEYFADADGDGYGDPAAPLLSCDVPANAVINDEDCDDTDPDTFPGNEELCDGVDNDCDNVVPAVEVDEDGDGFLLCEECADDDASVFPGALEICDGVDANCDGFVDDADFDGTGTADCDEVLVVVSYAFSEAAGLCEASGLTSVETEVEAVAAAAADLGLGAVALVGDELTGIPLQDMVERPVIVVLNGGLPWSDGFLANTLPALEAARAAGIPIYVIGDDAADGVDDFPALSTLLGLESYADTGAADSVNVLDASHPVVHGVHGDVQGFWCEGDMDVVNTATETDLIAEKATTGTPVIAVTDDTTRTVVQLFAAAAAHDICPQAPDTRTEPLLRNALEWLLE